MKNIIVICLLSLFISGCYTTQETIIRYEPTELKFEKSDPYKLDTSSISVPDPIETMYGKMNYDSTVTILDEYSEEEGDVIILTLNEYKKVAELLNYAITYKTITSQQEILINEKIKIENSLKELAQLERMKTEHYYSLWANSEQMYLEEFKKRKQEHIFHIFQQAVMLGTIIVVAI
jgi:hypothetical protein